MPVEIIGEAGTLGAGREWINAECELAIKHLKTVCGEPPLEMELEGQWQEHDLGEYQTIVLTWEDAMRGAPWDYIQKCEEGRLRFRGKKGLRRDSVVPIRMQNICEVDCASLGGLGRKLV